MRVYLGVWLYLGVRVSVGIRALVGVRIWVGQAFVVVDVDVEGSRVLVPVSERAWTAVSIWAAESEWASG